MKFLLAIFVFFTITINHAQAILSVREQATVIDEILEERFDQLLPKLMDQAEIDMWVVISREYNEDPVIKTMLPATWLNARRRTILLFYRDKKNNTIEKLTISLSINSFFTTGHSICFFSFISSRDSFTMCGITGIIVINIFL